jgi:hypothetical protein
MVISAVPYGVMGPLAAAKSGPSSSLRLRDRASESAPLEEEHSRSAAGQLDDPFFKTNAGLGVNRAG